MTVVTATIVWRDVTIPSLGVELDVALTNTYDGVTQLSCKNGQTFHIPVDQYRLIEIQYSEVPSK